MLYRNAPRRGPAESLASDGPAETLRPCSLCRGCRLGLAVAELGQGLAYFVTVG
jgi:hypothetical protein